MAEKLTRRELEAMANYLTSATHSDLRGVLNLYLTAPEEDKEKILSAIWERYGDRIKATM